MQGNGRTGELRERRTRRGERIGVRLGAAGSHIHDENRIAGERGERLECAGRPKSLNRLCDRKDAAVLAPSYGVSPSSSARTCLRSSFPVSL